MIFSQKQVTDVGHVLVHDSPICVSCKPAYLHHKPDVSFNECLFNAFYLLYQCRLFIAGLRNVLFHFKTTAALCWHFCLLNDNETSHFSSNVLDNLDMNKRFPSTGHFTCPNDLQNSYPSILNCEVISSNVDNVNINVSVGACAHDTPVAGPQIHALAL